MKWFYLIPAFAGIALSLHAAPWSSPKSGEVEALRHLVDNQETELRAFEQKLESLNTILETLSEQIENTAANQKAFVKGSSSALETKIASLEAITKSLTADLKQLHGHANETSTAFEHLKQKLGEWDQRIQNQNQNIENLQAALQTMMDALQAKVDVGPNWNGKTYKVKERDTLEKIAKAHGTTIQAIKEINNLSSDKIVVGKTLKIPWNIWVCSIRA